AQRQDDKVITHEHKIEKDQVVIDVTVFDAESSRDSTQLPLWHRWVIFVFVSFNPITENNETEGNGNEGTTSGKGQASGNGSMLRFVRLMGVSKSGVRLAIIALVNTQGYQQEILSAIIQYLQALSSRIKRHVASRSAAKETDQNDIPAQTIVLRRASCVAFRTLWFDGHTTNAIRNTKLSDFMPGAIRAGNESRGSIRAPKPHSRSGIGQFTAPQSAADKKGVSSPAKDEAHLPDAAAGRDFETKILKYAARLFKQSKELGTRRLTAHELVVECLREAVGQEYAPWQYVEAFEILTEKKFISGIKFWDANKLRFLLENILNMTNKELADALETKEGSICIHLVKLGWRRSDFVNLSEAVDLIEMMREKRIKTEDIVDALNKQGLATRRGNRWTEKNVEGLVRRGKVSHMRGYYKSKKSSSPMTQSHPGSVKSSPIYGKDAEKLVRFFDNDRQRLHAVLLKWQAEYKTLLGKQVSLEQLTTFKDTLNDWGTEYFRIVGWEGRYTGEIRPRDLCHADGTPHKIAVVFLFDEEEKALIQVRSDHKGLFPGCRDYSVGEHLGLDWYPLEGAVRGTEEEIFNSLVKLDSSSFVRIGEEDSLIFIHEFPGVKNCEIVTVYGRMLSNTEKAMIVRQESEVKRLEWVGLEEELEKWQFWRDHPAEARMQGIDYASAGLFVFNNPEVVTALKRFRDEFIRSKSSSLVINRKKIEVVKSRDYELGIGEPYYGKGRVHWHHKYRKGLIVFQWALLVTDPEVMTLYKLQQNIRRRLPTVYAGSIQIIPLELVNLRSVALCFQVPRIDGQRLQSLWDKSKDSSDAVKLKIEQLRQEAEELIKITTRLIKTSGFDLRQKQYFYSENLLNDFIVPSRYLDKNGLLKEESTNRPVRLYFTLPIDIFLITKVNSITRSARMNAVNGYVRSHLRRIKRMNEVLEKKNVRNKLTGGILQYTLQDLLLPKTLYYYGNKKAVQARRSVGFTGSTNTSSYGKSVARGLAFIAGAEGWVVNACFVEGSDISAHRGAAEAKAMSNGFVEDIPRCPHHERIFTLEMRTLLADGGSFLSEHRTKQR
ncbi:MAG: hypothetical protein V2A70_03835, partial [Candidatus Omnitrophota bacterium]